MIHIFLDAVGLPEDARIRIRYFINPRVEIVFVTGETEIDEDMNKILK